MLKFESALAKRKNVSKQYLAETLEFEEGLASYTNHLLNFNRYYEGAPHEVYRSNAGDCSKKLFSVIYFM